VTMAARQHPAILSRPLALPPVRFERQRFDGGVEPFNC
jgi:hypothetical protein